MIPKYFILVFTTFAFTSATFQGEDYTTGVIDLGNGGDDIFYWLCRPRNGNLSAPMIVWLSGGPGCSSSVALLFENGPFSLNENLEILNNTHSWNNKYYVLFIDQPVGVGYSQVKDTQHMCNNETCVAHDLTVFFNKFYYEYPEFKGKEMFIFGESYAGHYVPSVANYLVESENPDINLKGIAIGNGLVDAFWQYGGYSSFALENDLLNYVDYYWNRFLFSLCQASILMKWYSINDGVLCSKPVNDISGDPRRFNLYDIRTKKSYGFFNYAVEFLTDEKVKDQLGVKGRNWTFCNMDVYAHLAEVDWWNSVMDKVQDVQAKGVQIMVYNGMCDYIVNWKGSQAWVYEMPWSGLKKFRKMEYSQLKDGDHAFAEYKKLENFSFVKFYEAGHMVPMDQPKYSSLLLDIFVNNNFPDAQTL